MLPATRSLLCLLPLCITGCVRLPLTPAPAPLPPPPPAAVVVPVPLREPTLVVIEPRPVAALVVGKHPPAERRAAHTAPARGATRYVPVPPPNAHELVEVALTHRSVMQLQALSDADVLGPIVEMALPPDTAPPQPAAAVRTASHKPQRKTAERMRLQ